MAKDSKKPLNKAGVLQALAEKTGLGKKEVGGILEALAELAQEQLGKKGPGVFVLPNVIKLVKRVKPATPARKGINPFTKEPQTFKAKPASVTVNGNTLKKYKEAIK